MLMELYGRPMLSTMLASSEGGIISRDGGFDQIASRAVSSMRVPVLARKCRLNWPASVVGKKSCPSHGNQQKDSAANNQKPGNEDRPIADAGWPTYGGKPARTASKPRSKPR